MSAGFQRAYFDYAADATVASRLPPLSEPQESTGTYYTPNTGSTEIVADSITVRLATVTQELNATDALFEGNVLIEAPIGENGLDVSGNANVTGQLGARNIVTTEGIVSNLSISASGDIDAVGTISAETSFYQGTASSNSYTVVDTDGIGNGRLQTVARDTGNGQAYHDLVTVKPGPTYTFRRLVDFDGDCYIQNDAPAGTLQQMYWDAAGTNMLFNFGGVTGLTVKPVGVTSPSFVTSAVNGASLVSNGTTTVATFNASDFAVGRGVTEYINLVFFSGDFSAYFQTVVELTHFSFPPPTAGTTVVNARIENTYGVPPGWTVALANEGTPTMQLTVTTAAAPIGPGGEFYSRNQTVLGGQ